MMQIIQRLQEIVSRSKEEEILSPLEKKGAKEVGSIFMEQGRLFMDKFEKNHKSKFTEAVSSGDVNKDFDYVFEATAIKLKDVLKKINERAMKAGGAEQIADLEAGISFSLDNTLARQFIEQRGAEMVTAINDTTRSRINTILQKSSESGWNYAETAKAIKSEFEQFAGKKPQMHIRNRAELVSVTENRIAFEKGKKESVKQMQDVGLEMEKRWANSGDSRVSEGCLENSSVGWIDEDDVFPSGHDTAPRFPGCRCSVLHQRKKEDNE